MHTMPPGAPCSLKVRQLELRVTISRAGESPTCGLLVPNWGLRPTVFESILARNHHLPASLLTQKAARSN